ncbi:MAG: S16 family serine protease [Candidatus Micrarchaeota archaeon]
MRLLLSAVLVICFGLAVIVGYVSTPSFAPAAKPAFAPSATPLPPQSPTSVYAVTVKLPAVSKAGQGALADFTASAVSGGGKLFLRFDEGSPLTNPDTQYSLRNAFDVARRIAGSSASGYDVYFIFSADSDVVGGQSAGAAMAIATLSALTRTPLKEGVLITGSLNADGSIGRVGKVLAKAHAARAAGYSTLLVPEGESLEMKEVQKCRSEVVDGTAYQTCTSDAVEVDVGSETGMEVIEVSDVRQAFDIMRV